MAKDEDEKHEEDEDEKDWERGGGKREGFKLDKAKIRTKGKSRTRQTVQLRTSKIRKTRRQAGGLMWYKVTNHNKPTI